MILSVSNLPNELAINNSAYLSSQLAKDPNSTVNVKINGKVLKCSFLGDLDRGKIGLSKNVREFVGTELGKDIKVKYVKVDDYLYSVRVIKSYLILTGDQGKAEEKSQIGQLVSETQIDIKVPESSSLVLESKQSVGKNIFRPDFNIEDMGIGGLDEELFNIFRRTFASRRYSASAIKRFGVKHVKGILLYGPPGTGKTLIARQLAKALNVKDLKIVNGP
ncbi:unnamed protein product [Sphagnum balticum]